MRITMVLAAFAMALVSSVDGLQAQTVAEFYEGKTVKVVSPSGPGGSNYRYTLLVANHIGKHLPGNPNSIIEQRSGGGGIKAATYMSNAAPQDGTVIALNHTSSVLAPLMRDVDFSPYDFQWLGSVAVRSYVGAVWSTLAADRLDEMTGEEVLFGASGLGSPSYQNVTFVAHLAGANVRVITGYDGGGEINLAMERGELNGRGVYYEGILATNPDWVRDGTIKFVFKMGPDHPDLADIPAAADYATTGIERQMLELMETPPSLGQAFYVAGGVPEDRVEALRQAFVSMLEDPDFLAEAESLRLLVKPRGHDELAAVMEAMKAVPADVVASLKAIITKKE